MKRDLLESLRRGDALSLRQQLALVARLSLPAMLAQVSSVFMQYIDASMVGQLGANESAAIGLVSSSSWLLGGVCMSAATGFTVQVAQRIGAGEQKTAREILAQSFAVTLLICALLMALGAAVSGGLPRWLGGGEAICADASRYFLVFSLSLPLRQIVALAGGMLRCSGNMRAPSLLNVLMCGLDVVFNALLIFPAREVSLLGMQFTLPGANLGVTGAALGTALAELVVAALMLFALLGRSPMLRLRRGEKLRFHKPHIVTALKIALPVAFERIVMSGAQVVATRIVAPFGTIAIAANSFAVTAESLCYMPGQGISDAATTLVGQSFGAKRLDMTRRLGYLCTGLGMAVMTLTGVLMYALAPEMIGILSPVEEIRALGAQVLRIEAFAEPFFAAAIVAAGVLRGVGDTFVPSCISFFSMWAVRLPLAALLAPSMGLRGVWVAMCIELCVRGALFLARLKSKRWLESKGDRRFFSRRQEKADRAQNH